LTVMYRIGAAGVEPMQQSRMPVGLCAIEGAR
jgi:hypothetical protein